MCVVLHARVDQVLYVGAVTWSRGHAGQCMYVRTSVHVEHVLVLGSCWPIEQAASAVIEGGPMAGSDLVRVLRGQDTVRAHAAFRAGAVTE